MLVFNPPPTLLRWIVCVLKNEALKLIFLIFFHFFLTTVSSIHFKSFLAQNLQRFDGVLYGDAIRLKIRNPKRHIWHLYLIYIPNFNFLAQFGGELMREINSKHKKTYPKNRFWGCTGEQWVWKVKILKRHFYGPYQVYIPYFNVLISWLILRGDGDRHFSKSKREKILISPLQTDLEGWFLDTSYNFGLSVDWLKKGQFLQFSSISTLSRKFGHH